MKLFDKLQHMLFRIRHEEAFINLHQHRPFTDEIFEEVRYFMCESFKKSFKAIKSSIESKNIITRWKSSWLNSFIF